MTETTFDYAPQRRSLIELSENGLVEFEPYFAVIDEIEIQSRAKPEASPDRINWMDEGF